MYLINNSFAFSLNHELYCQKIDIRLLNQIQIPICDHPENTMLVLAYNSKLHNENSIHGKYNYLGIIHHMEDQKMYSLEIDSIGLTVIILLQAQLKLKQISNLLLMKKKRERQEGNTFNNLIVQNYHHEFLHHDLLHVLPALS